MLRAVAVFDIEEVRSWACGGRCQPELWKVSEWGCEARPAGRGDICSLGALHPGPHMVCDPDSHDPGLHAVYTWDGEDCEDCGGDGVLQTRIPWLEEVCRSCGGRGVKP